MRVITDKARQTVSASKSLSFHPFLEAGAEVRVPGLDPPANREGDVEKEAPKGTSPSIEEGRS